MYPPLLLLAENGRCFGAAVGGVDDRALRML
eukprot:COSAG01_NODE_62472_length_284_cov_1.108108_1_plen_30_part_10